MLHITKNKLLECLFKSHQLILVKLNSQEPKTDQSPWLQSHTGRSRASWEGTDIIFSKYNEMIQRQRPHPHIGVPRPQDKGRQTDRQMTLLMAEENELF